MREGLNQFVLHLVGDLWNLGVFLLMNQPAEELLFFHQVTLVDVRDSSLEQNHCRKLFNAPLVCFIVIVNLNKCDVVLIALVVDVFEFSENLLRLLRVFVVC